MSVSVPSYIVIFKEALSLCALQKFHVCTKVAMSLFLKRHDHHCVYYRSVSVCTKLTISLSLKRHYHHLCVAEISVSTIAMLTSTSADFPSGTCVDLLVCLSVCLSVSPSVCRSSCLFHGFCSFGFWLCFICSVIASFERDNL